MSNLQEFVDDAKRLSTMFKAVAELGNVAEKLAQAESVLANFDSEQSKAEAELADVKKQVATVKANIKASVDKANADLAAMVDKASADKDALIAEGEQVKAQRLAEAQAAIAEVENTRNHLINQIAIGQTNVASLDQEILDRQAVLKSINDEIDALKDKFK